MSLLLDALKRAEQEKLARGERPGLQVVPEAGHSSAPPPVRAPKAGLELEPIASGASSTAAPSPANAQAVFQAKAAAAREAESRRGVIYAAAGSIIVAVIAAGAYVWYVMKSLSPPITQASRAALGAPGQLGPVPPAPSARPLLPLPPEAPTPPPASGIAPPVATAAPASATRRDALVEQLLREPAARAQPPLRLDRSQAGPRVMPAVASGYDALRSGDLAAARRHYQAALGSDAANLDAHLGMATVEARAGNSAAAAAHYRRALELDRRNPTALAGMAALAETSSAAHVESQLRQDLMTMPATAALHFALGNVLAAQSRWSEAQAEYFEAHRLDPAHPDIAHNLAVSLDHIGQARPAGDFYRRALAGARSQPAQFDRAAVERRLAELGP